MYRHRSLKLACSILIAVACLCAVLRGNSRLTARADETQAKDVELRSQVRSLIVELDSNQRARRQKAEKDLLELGPRILSLLPPPELLPNVAVRSTVARVRVKLEQQHAQESVQPSRVTIPGGLELKAWLQQVGTQSGNRVDVSELPVEIQQRRVTDNFQSTPFWIAMESVLRETHLRYRFAADSSVLKLVPGSDPGADVPWLAKTDGPFRLSVNWVKPRAVSGDEQMQRLRTEMAVAPEPRLRALFLKLAAKDFRATGPRGQVFSAADPGAQYDLPLGEGGRYVRWNLDFAAPSGLADADLFPLKITGQGTMQIAAANEQIRFTDLVAGEGTARRRGGVTVTVQKIKSRTLPNEKLAVSVKVLVTYDYGGPAFESHRTWIFHNQVYLDRQSQEPLAPNAGFETDLQANGAVGVTYRFEGLAGKLEDYQFVYVAPTLIVEVPFKIELNGVAPPVKN
jgi:hypothetical protein